MVRAAMAAIVVSMVTASAVAAQPAKRASPAAAVWERFAHMAAYDDEDVKDARFAFNLDEVLVPAPSGALHHAFDLGFGSERTTVAFAANGQAAWVIGDIATYQICGDETCIKQKPQIESLYHATALFSGGTAWQPVFWHVDDIIDSKSYAAAVANGEAPEPVADKVVKADDVVALFRTSLASPAALAATISTRSDVVLLGTDRKERYVGGKQVATTLRKWSLAFTVRDGVQAGVTAGGTIAWVAANVDAVSSKKPGGKPSPYRVTAIYEKSDAGWKVVALHFSF